MSKKKLCKTCVHFTGEELPTTETSGTFGMTNNCMLYNWIVATEDEMAVKCPRFIDKEKEPEKSIWEITVSNIAGDLLDIQERLKDLEEIESTVHATINN